MNERYHDIMLDKEIRKAFGIRLKSLRNKKGWTQKELAAMINIGFSQFNKYELGLHVPPLEKLIHLAKTLDTTMDFLLMGADDDTDTLNNTRLLKRFREIGNLKAEDQDAIIKILDGMILKNKMQGVMALDE